jgi:hypothetical protein
VEPLLVRGGGEAAVGACRKKLKKDFLRLCLSFVRRYRFVKIIIKKRKEATSRAS